MALAAAIWDFGGVFTTSPFEAFNRHEAERGLPRDFIRQVNASRPQDNAWARFERAEIGPEEFDALFLEESRSLGHGLSGREVLGLLAGAVRPRMVAALLACKARFKVGCITNNVATGHGRAMAADAGRGRQASEIFDLFDHVIESSKVGVRKPDPRIYRMMCEALKVEPRDCVYLDDIGVNCKGAASLGMRAIKVVSEDQALAELAALTGLEFEPAPDESRPEIAA